MRKHDHEFIELTEEANKKGLATYELLEVRALSNLSVDEFTKTIILKRKLQSFLERQTTDG